MRVSIGVTNYSWPDGPRRLGSELAGVVRGADQAGVDTVWVVDHLLQADPTAAPGDTEMLEAYTTLGSWPAQTERVRLGTMVTGVTFRPPALLVKAVTTLDVLSGGRAWLGLGAGYPVRRRRPWACRCPRSPSGSSGWRRPCGSRPGCGPGTRPRSRAGTPAGTAGGQSAAHPASRAAHPDRRHRRTEDPAPGRPLRRRLQPVRHPRRRPHRSPTSWRSWPGTAPTSAAPTTRSRRRSAPAWRPASPARRSCAAVRRPRSSASSTWSSSPPVRGRPARWPPWPTAIPTLRQVVSPGGG